MQVQDMPQRAALAAVIDAVCRERIATDDPALLDHRWATTLDKVAIDQPAHAPDRHALQTRDAPATPTPPPE